MLLSVLEFVFMLLLILVFFVVSCLFGVRENVGGLLLLVMVGVVRYFRNILFMNIWLFWLINIGFVLLFVGLIIVILFVVSSIWFCILLGVFLILVLIFVI